MSEIATGVIFVAADDVTRTMTTAAGFWALVGGTIMLLDALVVRETAGHAEPWMTRDPGRSQRAEPGGFLCRLGRELEPQ